MDSRLVKILLIAAALVLAGVIAVLVAGDGSDRPEFASSLDDSESSEVMPEESSEIDLGTARERAATDAATTGASTLPDGSSVDDADEGAGTSGSSDGADTGEGVAPDESGSVSDGQSGSSSDDSGDSDDSDDSGDSGDSGSEAGTLLTLEERQACYWDLVLAEDRAVAEAEEAYPLSANPPNVPAHVELRFRLMDEYQAVVGEEYGLSREELDSIIDEGIEDRWPMPPLER